MKRFLCLLYLSFNFALSQTNIHVKYTFFESYAHFGKVLPAYLQISDTVSYFEVNDRQVVAIDTIIGINTANVIHRKNEKKEINRSIKKRFDDNSLLCIENRNGWGADDVVLITEHIPKMDWELKDGEKEILGYLCKKATVSFRGRNYEAWYTRDLPIPDGPWKFNGLPGLILEIADDKNEVKIEAYTVEINKKENLTTTILDASKLHLKSYSWEEYCKYIDENQKRRVKGLRSIASESGTTLQYSFPFVSMELNLLYEQ